MDHLIPKPAPTRTLDDLTETEREELAQVLAALNLSAVKRGAAARWRLVDEDEDPAREAQKPAP